jgi:hypothetical protein
MATTPDKPGKDDFHRERSRFLDAFASLEEAMVDSLQATNDEKLAERLKGLRQIRNDLVHSQLRFVQLEGQLQAIAINAQDISSVARPARLLKLEDFRNLCCKIGKVRRSFG